MPEALVSTFDGGVAVHDIHGPLSRVSAGIRFRYFGPRPLTQDGGIKSKATNLVYANAGYRLTRHLQLQLEIFNLLDAHDSDIDYVYTSRLPGEPLAGVNDVHTHPSEPREFRGSLTYTF